MISQLTLNTTPPTKKKKNTPIRRNRRNVLLKQEKKTDYMYNGDTNFQSRTQASIYPTVKVESPVRYTEVTSNSRDIMQLMLSTLHSTVHIVKQESDRTGEN